MINYTELLLKAKELNDVFTSQVPYPHIIIDNFISDESILDEVLKTFPSKNDIDFYKYDNQLEKKLAMDQLHLLPTNIQTLLREFNSPNFLNFLEVLTGIDSLIPDPYYRGGGIHCIETGGKLDVHIDFNIHPKLKIHRRLNVILYLNKDWKEEYNGDFQVWEGHKENDKHVLTKLHNIVFATSEKSYHGHPEPLNTPNDINRKSLALYYYTVDRPENEIVDKHSTTFIKRPDEDDTLDDMRNKRNIGRF